MEFNLKDFVPVSSLEELAVGDWLCCEADWFGVYYRIAEIHPGRTYDLYTDKYYNTNVRVEGGWNDGRAVELGTFSQIISRRSSTNPRLGLMKYTPVPPYKDYAPEQSGDTDEDI